ncbi:hypothetical protein NPS01_37340 [Nocardioides psychrotolerans]|uniref:Phosphotransferase enzyme family protein n=1 Tax=Nocardioides psychrotolerans TaxID=1005945 RepID=A0A1I3QE19_9ACTN|nr:phosphotransferase [Nocardioides psychrotolerans]GEP40071.1 hypothetical protein NPS01_37340 [Nocardioides psychrotolerans]SFJ32383.1 Phosphotransferase enzyme family protein [Nocardioides psychrotolerans]
MSTPGSTTVLGPASVEDTVLAAMVADLLGHPSVDLLDVHVEPVAYDVASITTVSRHWVSGTARTPDGVRPWRIFVKHVQSWRHSPYFAHVPEEVQELAAAGVPWRIEPLVYRSNLHEHLPDGLAMPRALGVFDLAHDSAAVWLPEVAHPPVDWTAQRYERAAYLLGRLAGSPSVASRAGVGHFDWSPRVYLEGRLRFEVVPPVLGDDAWRVPGVMEAFGVKLRERMRAGAGRLDELVSELDALPRASAHGDASPNNLLPGAGHDDFVLIDFGFFMTQPVAFDLGQLMAGETQLGGGPDDLEAADAACVTAYTLGLGDEGRVVDEAVVRRAHALHLFLFAGVSALPGRETMPPAQLERRAALVRLSLDLLDATQP